jgi:hypothetical protein
MYEYSAAQKHYRLIRKRFNGDCGTLWFSIAIIAYGGITDLVDLIRKIRFADASRTNELLFPLFFLGNLVEIAAH